MESFSRGWNFLKQAWSMAFKDKDLLKPSIYALIVGMIVSVIGIIPIIGALFLFGGSRFGNVILFILGAILIFVQFVVSYVFSGMTVYLIYGYLAEGDGHMDKAGASFSVTCWISSHWQQSQCWLACCAMRPTATVVELVPALPAGQPVCSRYYGRKLPALYCLPW